MPTRPPLPAELLKRQPVQSRSIARVHAILDAAATELAEGEVEALTIRAVASRAGVPAATIYQFFDDRSSLVQAVASRYVGSTLSLLDEVLDDRLEPWQQALARIIDAYAELLAGSPAMRALWLAGAMDDATRSLATQADDLIADRLREYFGGPETTGASSDWRFLVSLIGALLRLAFAVDPGGGGDGDALERGKRVATLYVEDLLRNRPTAT